MECGGLTPLWTGRLDGPPPERDASSRVVDGGVPPSLKAMARRASRRTPKRTLNAHSLSTEPHRSQLLFFSI